MADSSNIRRFAALAALILFAIGVCIWTRERATARTHAAAAFFSSTLDAAHARESVSVGDRTYTIENGHVYLYGTTSRVDDARAAIPLKLAYEKTVARRAPLFAFPGFDPEALKDASGRLRVVQNMLADAQTDAIQARLIRESLYPTDFLDAAARLERARLNFLASGADSDAHVYEVQLRSTLSAYRRDLSAFRRALSRITPPPDAALSRDEALGAVNAFEAAADRVEHMLARRDACMRGHVPACDPHDTDLPAVAPVPRAAMPSAAVPRAQAIVSVFERAGVKFLPNENLVLLESSACVGTSSAPLLFTERYEDTNGLSYRVPLYVGGLSFDRNYAASDPAYAAAVQHAAWVPAHMNPLSAVACLDSAYDQGRFFTIPYVRLFAIRAALSSIAPVDAAPQLRTLEHAFAKDPYVRESDVRAYLMLAESLIGNAPLPDAMANEIVAFSLQMSARPRGMQHAALDISSFESMNLKYAALGQGSSIDPAHLFYERSGFFSLFGGANETIVGEREPYEPLGRAVPVSYSAPNPQILPALIEGIKRYETFRSNPARP